VLSFISLFVALGRLSNTQEYWNWIGNCAQCGRVKTGIQGLFCSNFASSRGCWTACNSVWCGECYTPPTEITFYHYQPTDETGFCWLPDKDEQRHKCARDGDHLLTPFQCDLCVFRTLMGRNPTPQDGLLSACICQVNLDALWGREATTVQANQRSIGQVLRMWNRLRVPPNLPALGPHPLHDTFRYGIAIAMILKSTDKGRYAPYQQFETIRKLRSGFTNTYMSSLVGSTNFHTVGGGTLPSTTSVSVPPTPYGLSDSQRVASVEWARKSVRTPPFPPQSS